MNNVYINEVTHPKDSLFSKNFSLSLKKDFIDNRKAILFTICGILGICITIGTFLGFNMTGGELGEIIFCGVMFTTIGCVVASMAFSNFKRKESRIASLLVPDTPFDKFILRWIAVVPILFIIMTCGFYLLEFCRIAVFKLSHSAEIVAAHSVYCNLLNPFKFFNMSSQPSGASILGVCFFSYLFSQAFYFLGSVLWPKLAFVKVFAILWVLQTVGSIMMISINPQWPFRFDIQINASQFFWIVAIVELVLTLIIYTLAYLRFRNTQVENKLF